MHPCRHAFVCARERVRARVHVSCSLGDICASQTVPLGDGDPALSLGDGDPVLNRDSQVGFVVTLELINN